MIVAGSAIFKDDIEKNTRDYVTHVGIYVGNNQMYHAGNPIGYTDLTSAYWQQHIICAGRIKQ